VWETLYFANLFKIKLKVTLNIGVTEVLPHNFHFKKPKSQKKTKKQKNSYGLSILRQIF
jgi:hypothetical protein